MEAVTSVLLERARHDTGLPRMVTASLVGHIALIAVLAAAAAISGRSREPDLREVMSIRSGCHSDMMVLGKICRALIRFIKETVGVKSFYGIKPGQYVKQYGFIPTTITPAVKRVRHTY